MGSHRKSRKGDSKMLKKKLTVTNSSFLYDPTMNDLNIALGMSFYFNPVTGQFKVDQNPHGDPDLVAMENVEVKEDFSSLKFGALYRNKATEFSIQIKSKCDQELLRIFQSLQNTSFQFGDAEVQRVSFSFEQGNVTEILADKLLKGKVLDSLMIFGKEEEVYHIIQSPWERIKLDSISVGKKTLLSQASTRSFEYKFELPPMIMGFVESLIQCIIAVPVQKIE